MPSLSLPLPFAVALLLVPLFVRLVRRGADPVARLFMMACVAKTVVVGVRYGYAVPEVRGLQACLAAALPPLAYFTVGASWRGRPVDWMAHGAAPLMAVVLALVWPPPLDLVVPASFAAYGARLAWIGLRGADAMVRARLGEPMRSLTMLWIVVALMIVSVVADVAIAADFAWTGGAHVPAAVTAGYALLLITVLAANAAAEVAVAPREAAVPDPPAADDPAIPEDFAAVDAALHSRKLHLDPDLTLERLARKTGIPARRISAAVNATTGLNLSQYVNSHRIAEACRLLRDDDRPVTDIMFDSGFRTKSNFNREFRRIMGSSPSEYRATERRQM